MNRIGRFLRVEEVPLVGRKTRRWHVIGNGGDVLGSIYWRGAWRQYVFEADKRIYFNRGCLNDLSAFLADRNEAHRNGKSGEVGT